MNILFVISNNSLCFVKNAGFVYWKTIVTILWQYFFLIYNNKCVVTLKSRVFMRGDRAVLPRETTHFLMRKYTGGKKNEYYKKDVL